MWRSACILVVTGALVGALATPADAAESGVPGSAVLGGFSLGDGLEALVDEHDGALRVDLPVAGVGLVWDSRRVGHDRSGLGVGWGWAVGSIDVQGGVRVFPSSGGVYDADASAPTGLAGYGGGDVRFEQREGMLEARPGVVETRLFSYVLHELGGGSTYFSAAGDPIAQVAATGDRLDWLWANEPAHRLTAVVGAEGVRTELEWTADQETVVVRPAANVPGSAGSEWRIELGTYGPTEVVDAGDHVRSVGYDPQGNLVAVTSATGAATEVEWASSQDGVTRVSRVQTVEPDGDELSTREWSVAAGDSPTGWPVRADGAATDVVTRLSDGASEVVSSYSSAGLLAHRSFRVSEPAGLRAVQEVEFGYASASGGVPASWARPTSTAITALDARGGARETRESRRYDELGRVVEHTSADGSITRTEYDPRVVEPIGGLPVGLPVREVLEAPDGLVRERVNTLNERGTAVIATQITERAAGAEAAVTERVEYDVDDDGFVRTKREYPTGPTVAVPVVTSWNEQVDLAAGTVTTTQTVGAGTAAEATTAQVTSLVHGGVVAEVDALGHRTSADFDELGRLEARHDVEGRVTTYAYESGDGQRTVTETAPDGVARSEVHDALGRVVEIFDNIDHGEPVRGYVRRVESREYRPGMVRVTDAWGAVSTSRHDAFGRTVAAEGPSGAAELTEYDDARGVVRSGRSTTGDLAGASVVRETTLDAAGRAVRVDETRYDGSQMTATSEFDGFGRPTSTESAGLETEVRYDEFGRPSSTTLTSTEVGGGSATPSDPLLTAAADFDSFGRTTGKTLSDRDASYDGYTRTLDELGRMVEEVDPSGASTTYDYTVDGLVETIATSAGQRTEIEYDPTTREKVLERVTSPVGDDVATAFEYDPATGRLSAVADADDPQGTRIDYEYDAFGNPLEVAYSDGAVLAYEYDEHGRRTRSVDGAVSGYDAANRRVSTTSADGVTTTTGYWPDGSRRSQVTGDVATSFYWDGDTLINERETHGESDAAGTASYLIGASRLARSTSTASSARAAEYYSTDRHGNVTELTDQRGAVVATYDYSDYGVTSSSVRRGEPKAGLARNPFQYAGEYTDRDGTQFLATRVYHSGTARFTSMDKAPLENRFAFADLNPIMHVDPTGQTSALDVVNWIVAGTALVAGIASVVGTFWAVAVSNTFAGLSIAAAVADTVALGFATTGLVDSYAFHFMDRKTADLVALGDITLGLGLGLGVAVLDGIITHPYPLIQRTTALSRKSSKSTPFLSEKFAEGLHIGPPTMGAARAESKQWLDLKAQMQLLVDLDANTQLIEPAMRIPTVEELGLARKLKDDDLFVRLAGMTKETEGLDEDGIALTLLNRLTFMETMDDLTIRNPALPAVNRKLVLDSRAIVFRLTSKPYAT
jgi:RHS repeat-associated protein